MMKKWKHKRHNVPPNPSPFPLHIHTVHVWHFYLAADFQLNFRIEVNITVEPFHPSSHVNGYCFAATNPRGVGSGTKNIFYGKALHKVQPFALFLHTILNRKGTWTPFSSFVLPSKIPTLSYTGVTPVGQSLPTKPS